MHELFYRGCLIINVHSRFYEGRVKICHGIRRIIFKEEETERPESSLHPYREEHHYIRQSIHPVPVSAVEGLDENYLVKEGGETREASG